MQVKRTNKSDNEVVLLITGDLVELGPLREHILKDHFAQDVKLPGFRQGKAPLNLVEKNINQQEFQTKFLDEALNNLYGAAIDQEKIRAIDQPKVEVKKFVPYTLVEFEVVIPVLGKVTLPDYKKIKLAKPLPKPVTPQEIDQVLKRLQIQLAEKKDVNRAAKNEDQVYIDFKGVDDKGNAVSGAEGRDFPLVLGSDSFIPGFEKNLVGLKPGAEKTFTLKFPKDYLVSALASKNVTFTVTVIKVQEVSDPKLDDEFAKKVGSFETMAELKKSIKAQLTEEKENTENREYESKLLEQITDKSKVTIPDLLVDAEVENRLSSFKTELGYQGRTFDEFLKGEGQTEAEYIEKVVKPDSIKRLKASIVLSEISDIEQIPLSNEEVDARLQQMNAQYQDARSQADLAKPEARREVASRLLAEKTIAKLVDYATRSTK